MFRERYIQTPGIFGAKIGTFHKKTSLKNFFMFRKTDLSLIFQEVTFWAWKKKTKPILKMFVMFQEMELFSQKIRNFLIFQQRTCKVWKTRNFLYFFKHVLIVEREFFKHKRKRKKFPILFLIKKQSFLN